MAEKKYEHAGTIYVYTPKEPTGCLIFIIGGLVFLLAGAAFAM